MHKRLRAKISSFCPEKVHIPLSCPERDRVTDNCVYKAWKRKRTRDMLSRSLAKFWIVLGKSMFISLEIWVQVRSITWLRFEPPGP